MSTTQHSNPPPQRVPAAAVRDHVVRLLGAGLSPAVISKLAGVELRRINGLLEFDQQRVSHRIAAAVLAVPIPAGMFVPAVGPVRRLQALVRIGYGFDDLAAAIGCDASLLADIALSRCDVVDAEFADRITELFASRHAEPGPSDAARELGRRHRFAAPLAWAVDDDDTAGSIDDPGATPDGLPAPIAKGVPADFADIVADHRDLGHYDEDIADAFGLSLNTLSKRLQRAGIPERRRGTGARTMTSPLYGARYRVRLPRAMQAVS
ncbi:hypothetical protein LV457_02680 [Mycobacterium sp. MYCO198283]|uniref:hypothetical protein n=1 Tax=Mycobacterium sp. MYCO198283 TaxID=2883505 RepID=UPI001E48C3EB|nr:hypothetical protein [Mycobacterium sp. MYCO198283]MCG5431195.1 hypothetical protein [Mycobacterium sp. MYCO198283]